MSQATEKKIVKFVGTQISLLEKAVERCWDSPTASQSYLLARAEFREALERRIRNHEWLKER